jgi:hypothetical protein
MCGMKNFNKTVWEDKQHETTFSQGLFDNFLKRSTPFLWTMSVHVGEDQALL